MAEWICVFLTRSFFSCPLSPSNRKQGATTNGKFPEHRFPPLSAVVYGKFPQLIIKRPVTNENGGLQNQILSRLPVAFFPSSRRTLVTVSLKIYPFLIAVFFYDGPFLL